jgi:hypothetical protein
VRSSAIANGGKRRGRNVSGAETALRAFWTAQRRRETSDAPMPDGDFEPALKAANIALIGRRQNDVSRVASIDLRFADARSGAWEVVAMAAVGFATLLGVVAVWFL